MFLRFLVAIIFHKYHLLKLHGKAASFNLEDLNGNLISIRIDIQINAHKFKISIQQLNLLSHDLLDCEKNSNVLITKYCVHYLQELLWYAPASLLIVTLCNFYLLHVTSHHSINSRE